MISEESILKLKEMLMDTKKEYASELFNSNKESTWAKAPIRVLKFTERIAEKLFFPLIMTFPFHPLTGDTSVYNDSIKYTSVMAPSLLMQVIKHECSSNKELKELYMRTASYRGEWDTTLTDSFTEADKKILWIYRRRITYIQSGLRINSKAVSGNKYPAIYLLDSQQDPATGAYIGELSIMHQLGNLVGSLTKLEIDSFNESVTSKDISNNMSKKMHRDFTTSNNFVANIEALDSQDAKERRGEIRKCYPFTAPQSILSTIGLSFSIAPKTGNLREQISSDKYEFYDHFLHPKEDLEKHIFYTTKWNCVNAIDSIVGNYFPKDPKNYKERDASVDLYIDFAVLDFITECTKENLTKTEKMLEANLVNFISEKSSLFDVETQKWKDSRLEEFMERLSSFHQMAEEKDLFQHIKSLLSRTFGNVDNAITNSAIRYVETNLPLSLPIYTPEIKTLHSEILLELFPEEMINSNILTSNIEDSEKSVDLYEKLLQETEVNSYDGVQLENEKEENLLVEGESIEEEEEVIIKG